MQLYNILNQFSFLGIYTGLFFLFLEFKVLRIACYAYKFKQIKMEKEKVEKPKSYLC